MPARLLLLLFDSAYVLALAAWFGSILFFSFGVAPLIFGVLGEQAGGRFVRALLPRCYLWGSIAGSIALPAYVAVPLCYPEYRGPRVGLQALAILAGILIMLYGGNSLTPAINQARDAGPAGEERFAQLHRRAKWLDALVLVIGLGLLIGFATRPAPRYAGLADLTPAERARYDAAIERVIEDIETKYGMRMPGAGAPREPGKSDAVVDEAAVREIDALYAEKKRRDEARAKARSRARPAGPGEP
jgi:hypothetical protein